MVWNILQTTIYTLLRVFSKTQIDTETGHLDLCRNYFIKSGAIYIAKFRHCRYPKWTLPAWSAPAVFLWNKQKNLFSKSEKVYILQNPHISDSPNEHFKATKPLPFFLWNKQRNFYRQKWGNIYFVDNQNDYLRPSGPLKKRHLKKCIKVKSWTWPTHWPSPQTAICHH